jgi:hypothetical protein
MHAIPSQLRMQKDLGKRGGEQRTLKEPNVLKKLELESGFVYLGVPCRSGFVVFESLDSFKKHASGDERE